MSDQGAKALEYRLSTVTLENAIPTVRAGGHYTQAMRARDILGTTGLFIADVTKHEPWGIPTTDESSALGCSCGWESLDDQPDESYFDHIGARDAG